VNALVGEWRKKRKERAAIKFIILTVERDMNVCIWIPARYFNTNGLLLIETGQWSKTKMLTSSDQRQLTSNNDVYG